MDPQLEQRFREWYREQVHPGSPDDLFEASALSVFHKHNRTDVRFPRHMTFLKRPPWRDGEGADSDLSFLDFPPVLLALRAGMGII